MTESEDLRRWAKANFRQIKLSGDPRAIREAALARRALVVQSEQLRRVETAKKAGYREPPAWWRPARGQTPAPARARAASMTKGALLGIGALGAAGLAVYLWRRQAPAPPTALRGEPTRAAGLVQTMMSSYDRGLNVLCMMR